MKFKLIALATLALASLSAPALAQKSPLKPGSYVCREQGKVQRSFEITDSTSYTASNGRQGSYQYDPGLNVLNFDTGEQYFVGREDLLILVRNRQLSKHGCARQTR